MTFGSSNLYSGHLALFRIRTPHASFLIFFIFVFYICFYISSFFSIFSSFFYAFFYFLSCSIFSIFLAILNISQFSADKEKDHGGVCVDAAASE